MRLHVILGVPGNTALATLALAFTVISASSLLIAGTNLLEFVRLRRTLPT